jgi:hypothetical protein
MIRRNFLTSLLTLALTTWSAASASSPSVRGGTVTHATHSSQTLSMQQANNAFTHQAARHDIAFGYLRDGCSARAHLMIQDMEAHGIRAGKVWAFPPGQGQALAPSSQNHWRYHVAPVVHVQTAHGVVPMVIDPSLFSHPVTVEEWKQKQKTTAGHVPYVTQTAMGQRPTLPNGQRANGSYSPGGDPQNPDAQARQTMVSYLRQQRQQTH